MYSSSRVLFRQLPYTARRTIVPSAAISGTGVVVAVIDTGFRPHADLSGQFLPGYDFITDPFVSNDGGGRDNDAQDPGDSMTVGICGDGEPDRNHTSS